MVLRSLCSTPLGCRVSAIKVGWALGFGGSGNMSRCFGFWIVSSAFTADTRSQSLRSTLTPKRPVSELCTRTTLCRSSLRKRALDCSTSTTRPLRCGTAQVSLTHYTSHVTPHTSHLTRHTSHLTPHTSYLTPHNSHLTLVQVSPTRCATRVGKTPAARTACPSCACPPQTTRGTST
jgi:hypothetical protein